MILSWASPEDQAQRPGSTTNWWWETVEWAGGFGLADLWGMPG